MLERADKGVLFLDEITEIPIDFQAKLLRVMENQEFYRLGENDLKKVDVQFVAATNRRVQEAIEMKKLRADIYYRLAVIEITLSPLRERSSDIPELCELLILNNNKRYKKGLKKISDELLQKIQTYHWPGNIRELSNFITKWYLFESEQIEVKQIPNYEIGNKKEELKINKFNYEFENGNMEELEGFKKFLAEYHLKNNNYNKSKAAIEFGVSYPVYLKLLK